MALALTLLHTVLVLGDLLFAGLFPSHSTIVACMSRCPDIADGYYLRVSEREHATENFVAALKPDDLGRHFPADMANSNGFCWGDILVCFDPARDDSEKNPGYQVSPCRRDEAQATQCG